LIILYKIKNLSYYLACDINCTGCTNATYCIGCNGSD
jgi:hypothetical protein